MLFIVIILLMNAFFIISNHNLALKNTENIKELTSTYYSWLKNIVGNIVKITGEAIELEWVPK